MRVDSQVHVASPDRTRYPINPPEPLNDPWYDRSGRTAEELIAEMDAAGIDRVVLVQAYSAYGYDNRYTVDSANAHPDRFVCACIVDLTDNPLSAVRDLVLDGGARGIRLFLQRSDAGWLDESDADQLFEAFAELGIVAQAAVTAEQLPAVQRAASRHGEVPFLVDHCGRPDLSGGPSYPNARTLFDLADAPNLHVKLSSQVFGRARDAGADPAHFTEALVEAFGPTRVMWASDLTVHNHPYAVLIGEAEAASAGLDEVAKRELLGEAAARLWWPPA